MTAVLRRLRHGPLKGLGPIWLPLGKFYRFVFRMLQIRHPVNTCIGPYGPFRLNGLFAFSNFENWGGGHNDAFTDCVEACRGKICMIDIGAHVGLVALPAASVMQDGGRVYAFEPAYINKSLLDEHVHLNKINNIETLPFLIGSDDRDDVPFFEMDEATGMNGLVVSKNPDAFHATQKQQVSLDSFCSKRNLSPNVIKIDVEGAEIGVLEGGRQTITSARPTIFLSVHPNHLRLMGESTERLSKLIDELGYEVRDTFGHAVHEFALREYVLKPRKENVCP